MTATMPVLALESYATWRCSFKALEQRQFHRYDSDTEFILFVNGNSSIIWHPTLRTMPGL